MGNQIKKIKIDFKKFLLPKETYLLIPSSKNFLKFSAQCAVCLLKISLGNEENLNKHNHLCKHMRLRYLNSPNDSS